MGLITVAQGAAIDSQTNKLFVVDSQQRLITLCLILGALKCRLEARLKDCVDVNEKQQLTNLITRLSSKLWDEGDTLLDRPPSPRIELKKKDAKFFNKLLQNPMEFWPEVRRKGAGRGISTEHLAQSAGETEVSLMHVVVETPRPGEV